MGVVDDRCEVAWSMKRVIHRLSRLYPDSGLPLCRFGATEKQKRSLGVTTTDETKVTCKRCIALMAK